MRRTLRRTLTEQSSPGRLGWAVGIGVFIAVTPLYGLHSVMGVGAATAFRLNRPLTLLATTFPLPILQPALALGGLQLGAVALTGQPLPVTMGTVSGLDPWSVGTQWALGTVMLGTLLGMPLGVATTLVAARVRRRQAAGGAAPGAP